MAVRSPGVITMEKEIRICNRCHKAMIFEKNLNKGFKLIRRNESGKVDCEVCGRHTYGAIYLMSDFEKKTNRF